MKLAQLPNVLTIARLLAVVPLVWLLANRRFDAALWLALVAGFSDALDGYLAKRFNWVSRVGGGLDPLADKVLLLGAFISLAILGEVPIWLVALILGRDLLIITGGLYYNYRVAPVIPSPTWSSKLNTTLQILLVLVILLRLAYPQWAWAGEYWLLIATAVLTFVSGVEYVWIWGRKAHHELQRQRYD